MSPRLHTLLMTTTALLALAPQTGRGRARRRDRGRRRGHACRRRHRQRHRQSDEPNAAIINWNTFNIGTGESTQFNQPNSSSVMLNRVTGGLGASNIDGTLTANGRVFLVNRDGMLFGPNAVINTAGFVATTHDIKNDDFMAGRYNFNISGPAGRLDRQSGPSSPRRAAASPRWWRPACATPAPSPRRSAP